MTRIEKRIANLKRELATLDADIAALEQLAGEPAVSRPLSTVKRTKPFIGATCYERTDARALAKAMLASFEGERS